MRRLTRLRELSCLAGRPTLPVEMQATQREPHAHDTPRAVAKPSDNERHKRKKRRT
jgi:hypothetical protein